VRCGSGGKPGGFRCCSPISWSSYIFFYSPTSYFTRFYFAQLVVIDNGYQRPNLSDIATALHEDAMTRHYASAPAERPQTLHNANPPTQLFPFKQRPTCTIKEACSAVGLGRTKLYQLIRDGAIETRHVGRRCLVHIPSLLKHLQMDEP
jgi:excisionase family DNA binding protein